MKKKHLIDRYPQVRVTDVSRILFSCELCPSVYVTKDKLEGHTREQHHKETSIIEKHNNPVLVYSDTVVPEAIDNSVRVSINAGVECMEDEVDSIDQIQLFIEDTNTQKEPSGIVEEQDEDSLSEMPRLVIADEHCERRDYLALAREGWTNFCKIDLMQTFLYF